MKKYALQLLDSTLSKIDKSSESEYNILSFHWFGIIYALYFFKTGIEEPEVSHLNKDSLISFIKETKRLYE